MIGLTMRRQALDRLFALLSSSSFRNTNNITTAAQNRGRLESDQLTALYVLDGDEDAVDPRLGSHRGSPRMAPAKVIMLPQVHVVLRDQLPKNETVGEDLDALRASIVTAVAYDEELRAILGANGEIHYGGLTTDLKDGEAMAGQMTLRFRLVGFMNPYSN